MYNHEESCAPFHGCENGERVKSWRFVMIRTRHINQFCMASKTKSGSTKSASNSRKVAPKSASKHGKSTKGSGFTEIKESPVAVDAEKPE